MQVVFARFVPLEDITVYELAQIVANVGGHSHSLWQMAKPPSQGLYFNQKQWDELGKMQRHFVVA